MKYFKPASIFCLSIVISTKSLTQNHSLSDGDLISKAKKDFKEYSIIKPANKIIKGYMHLEGKTGNSKTRIDINMHLENIAYFFCDSINDIIEYHVNVTPNSFTLVRSAKQFWFSKNSIERIILFPTKQNCLIGYVLNASGNSSKCILKETYANGNLKFSNLSFSYKTSYKKFPISLTENILFADTNSAVGKSINTILVKNYDHICDNYEEYIKKISFMELSKLKTPDSFAMYSQKKFIKAYKNIIDSLFLNAANESGHTDIFENNITSQIVWNDRRYLVLEITIWFADGIAYPYYDTYFFEYDFEKKKMLSEKYLYSLLKKQVNDSLVISNLKQKNLYNAKSDDWFLAYPQIAFVTERGIILLRKGGNHGIEIFLKYYPYEIIQPLLSNTVQ